jgi:murein DD-endopeptidase MepM/ murein hydrolase activator NlpD
VAFLAAQGCDHTVLPQDRLKFFLPRARGTRPFQPFDGEVVGVRNDMPDGTPSSKQSLNIKTPFDYAGNFVHVRIRPDVYALYAHFQPGTVTVKPGDRVKTGTVLNKLGNSGNSTAPHLHFALLDRPDGLVGDSLPFVIDQFTVTGTLKAGGSLEQVSVEPKTLAVKDAYPLVREIVTYHQYAAHRALSAYRS